MGGSVKGDTATIGYRYYMSLQMGLCRGPIDEIVQINVGDVRAWPIPDGDSEAESGLALVAEGPNGNGVALYENGTSEVVPAAEIKTIRATSTTSIEAPDLFGGDKKEGGIQGSLTVYMGHKTQVYAALFKTWLGGLVPDFRGVVTMVYDGLLCSMNPYPKVWKTRVRRVLSGWDGAVWQPSLAVIWLRNGTIKAMNPAHIIYECLTNRDWGRGFARSLIDEAAFLQVAQVLYNEGLGLCVAWNRQDELGSFIQEIIDHVGGSLYLDRKTGLMTISLLRADYNASTLPTFDYDSGLISIEEDETNSRDDLVNETIVNWYDPIKDEDRQARVHNLASMQSTGAIRSTTTTYRGVPTVDLALRLGQRDLKVNATSLKRYKIVLDRRAEGMIPGSVFKISAPDKNILSIIVRAGKVSEAQMPDGRITVEAVIDVFGLPSASFIAGQETAWTPPDKTAVVIDTRRVRESTYRELSRSLSEIELERVSPTAGTVVAVAQKPTPLSLSYGIRSRVGSEAYVRRNTGSFVPVARLISVIGPYDKVISFNGGHELGLVSVGMMVEIGDEICRLDDISTIDGISGSITLARGCVDTIPMTHAAGTIVFFTGNRMTSDLREYVSGETVSVRLTTVTSTQELSVSLAPTDTITLTGRQGRPWPPADLKVNGTPFASLGTIGGDPVLTWVHRDRTIIQDQLIEHDAASVGPEPGTTYTIRIYRLITDTAPVRTVSGIADTSWTYTPSMRVEDNTNGYAVFELEAVRGSLKSQFKYRFAFSYPNHPKALAAFTASGASAVDISASTAADAYTDSIRFYRTAYGVALNRATDQLGSPVAAGSSAAVSITDAPGTGDWEYYAEPVGPSGLSGALSGPVRITIT